MRVAWDLQAVTGPGRTGLGVGVQLLLDAVQAEAPEVEICGFPPNRQERPLRGVPDRLAWEQCRLPAQVAREHRRRPLALCFSPALGAPWRCAVPVVAYVNDLIPRRYPEQFHGVSGWYWRQLLPATWRRCARICVSNRAVAEELHDSLGYPRERISTVPYYPDPTLCQLADQLQPEWAEALDRPVPDPPQFVTLGTHEPRKNLAVAIHALAWLQRQGVAARLVCVGGRTAHTGELEALAAGLGVGGAVAFPGYLDREAIVRLLLSATALVFPSLYEGYGLPPQEAQSIGCAVVVSDIACHRAVHADPARWATLPVPLQVPPPLVAPADGDGWGAALLKLVAEPLARMRQRRAGLAYSATFTRDATARALCAAFRAVAEKGLG